MSCAIMGLGIVTPEGSSFDVLAEKELDLAKTADVQMLEQFHTKRELRRTSQYSRLALLGANLALRDAGMSVESFDSGRLGVIVATGYGPARTTFDFLDSIHDFGAKLASPLAFSTSVHNIAASIISLKLGIAGPCLSINQFETSFASALESARCWLDEGRVDAVLVGAVDEYDSTLCDAIAAVDGEAIENSFPHSSPAEGSMFMLLTRDEVGKRGMLNKVLIQRRTASDPIKSAFPAGQALEVARAIALKQDVAVCCNDASGLESVISINGSCA